MCRFDGMCLKNLCAYKHSVHNQTISSGMGKEKDVASEIVEDGEEEKDYKFECAYCAFRSDEYNDFMEHINTNHLESEDENESDGKHLDNDNQA